MDLASDIKLSWYKEEIRFQKIEDFINILSTFIKEENNIHPSISSILSKLSKNIEQEDFHNFLLPLKREIQKGKYAHSFQIRQGDKKAKAKENTKLQKIYFLLEDVRSAFNIGSVFRLADCLNVETIFLCGYTADAKHPKVQKTAMGCDKTVATIKYKESKLAIKLLKEQGVKIIALETLDKSRNLFSLEASKEDICFVVGNEVHGISYEVLALCDEIIHIPVYGQKNSLNVAISLSIASYHMKHKI